ncbi:hypothetical protein ACWDG9_45835 [Streptomyces sp. NPDC001073]
MGGRAGRALARGGLHATDGVPLILLGPVGPVAERTHRRLTGGLRLERRVLGGQRGAVSDRDVLDGLQRGTQDAGLALGEFAVGVDRGQGEGHHLDMRATNAANARRWSG